MRAGCMEENLAGEAVSPAGLLPITGDELHMMVMTSPLKISPSTTRKRPTNGAPNLAINGALVVRH